MFKLDFFITSAKETLSMSIEVLDSRPTRNIILVAFASNGALRILYMIPPSNCNVRIVKLNVTGFESIFTGKVFGLIVP